MNEVAPPRPKQVRAPQSAAAVAAKAAGVPETPTQVATSTASRAPVLETDELGRVLKVKYLGIMDQMRIARVLGAELAKNDQYKGLASLAFCVIEINGEAIAPPVSVREVEFLVERIGEEGARAIGEAMKKAGWVKLDEESTDVDTAKN